MTSSRVAVLGAGGFIGSRVVESFHLQGWAEVRPIVRRISGLARSRRFNLDSRIADGCDAQALRAALAGCEYVVHAIAGDNATIVGTVEPVYRAAEHAGVRRIVYVSSASVHGQSPAPGTDENTPLREDQPIAYNNAKVKAERRFLRMRENGRVEAVMLRPGIVYGPRSPWIGGFANELLTGRAFVVEGAHGVCNSIYVDNVVRAIQLALTAPGADGHAFLVGDEETVTWRELYEPVTRAFGIPFNEIPSIKGSVPAQSSFERMLCFRDSKLGQALLPAFPLRLRHAMYTGLAAWLQYPPGGSPYVMEAEPAPVPDLERTLLQTCAWKLPSDKAKHMLGYSPQVSFTEGCRRSVEWLGFAGYPVLHHGGG
ncbi:MAG TPA: NAD-dependent epimerase/dehydratase family protein [Terriglobales bacterium]|jgi:nucleoside-diphosphate-sugar epimerase|nr:NAD-dependent epimerase/dehydratase family protein [Terriglobales bacterium]